MPNRVRIHHLANGNGRAARTWTWTAFLALRYSLPVFLASKPRPHDIAYVRAAHDPPVPGPSAWRTGDHPSAVGLRTGRPPGGAGPAAQLTSVRALGRLGLSDLRAVTELGTCLDGLLAVIHIDALPAGDWQPYLANARAAHAGLQLLVP